MTKTTHITTQVYSLPTNEADRTAFAAAQAA